MNPFHGPERKYDFKGYQGTAFKSNFYTPMVHSQKKMHPKNPHWISCFKMHSIFSEKKKFDTVDEYYEQKPDFPSDFRDVDGNKLDPKDIQYLSLKFEYHDLSKPHLTAPIKEWHMDIRDFKFRELIYMYFHSDFWYSPDCSTIFIIIGGRRVFLDAETLEEKFCKDHFRWESIKLLSKDYVLAAICDDLNYNWFYVLYDITNKKQIGEKRKRDNFKAEAGYKYYPEQMFMLKDQPDRFFMFCKKKEATDYTLAYYLVEKGLNQEPQHVPVANFSIPCKEMEIDEISVRGDQGLGVYRTQQEVAILNINKNEIRKIKLTDGEKKFWAMNSHSQLFYEAKEEKYHFYDFYTREEKEIDQEEGERLKKFDKDGHDIYYNLDTKMITGRNYNKIHDEEKKRLFQEELWGYEKPGESYEATFTTKYGKHEIMTNRLLAYIPFQDKIHLFDIFTLRTTVIELNRKNRFVTFFNQVEEDERKISFIEILPNEDVSVSHIWLNEIEDSAEKSIEKIEFNEVIIKNLPIHAMAHRVYWESFDETEGVFMQLPYKIVYYEKDEDSGEYKKIFSEACEPLQCVRPRFEKKRRWVYAQKDDTDTLIKCFTLGDKASKKAYNCEDTTLWAMSVWQHCYHGPDKGAQHLIMLTNKRQMWQTEVNWHKASQEILNQRKNGEDQRHFTQYGHDMLSKLTGHQHFMGFFSTWHGWYGKGFTVASGVQLFTGHEGHVRGFNEIDEYLQVGQTWKMDRVMKFVSLTDNFYYENDLFAFRNPNWGDMGCLSIQRHYNNDRIMMPFVSNRYFQVYRQDEEKQRIDTAQLEYYLFFKDDRIPVLFSPMLKFEQKYDFSEALQDERVDKELQEIGFQPEEDQKPPKSKIQKMLSSPDKTWHLFQMRCLDDIEFWMLGHFDVKKGFTKLQEFDYFKGKDRKLSETIEVSNCGAVVMREDMKLIVIPPYLDRKEEPQVKEIDLLETHFQGKDYKEISHFQLTYDSRILLTIDKNYVIMINFKEELKRLNWNPFNEEENEFVNQRFDILQACPFSDQPGDQRIGILLQNTRDGSNIVIIWNIEKNSEICMHIEKSKIEFLRSPSQLHFIGKNILKSALLGSPEYYQDETDQLEIKNWKYMLAEHDRNLIVSHIHQLEKRSCMFLVPNRPLNAIFQRFLLKRERNYVLGKRLLTFFKDPSSGESIFSQIGFKMEYLQDLKKSVELCAEQHERGVKDFYPLLLEPSFLDPNQDSLFKKACKISTTFQNAYLAILAESEEDYNTNSVVIPDTKTFKDMIECANFGPYLEACKREVEPDPVYKAYWADQDRDDRKTFLRPFSYVTLQFKATQLGEPVEPDLRKEITEFRDKEGFTQRKIDESSGFQEQNVFLEAIQLEFLHNKDGVKEFCHMMATLKDDKLLALKVVGVVVDVLWEMVFPKILKMVFYPYLVYFATFIFYVTNVYEPDHRVSNPWKFVFLPPCVLFSVYILSFEAYQMKTNKWDYFTDASSIWNYLDLASSGLMLVFSFTDMLSVNWGSTNYLIGALAVFFLWLKLFYFFRLFKNLSFFVRMIIEMFFDIRFFLLVFFCAIFAFGNAFMVLDYTDTSNPKIVNESFGTAVNYFYMQSIGEYDVEGYQDHPQETMYWVYYYMSTIFIQITLLNLIIAIMGDTYDRVVEVKQESSLKEVCSFISEYFMLFPSEDFENNSLVLIAGLEGSDNKKGATWEGKLGAIKNAFRGHIANVENKLMKMNESIHVDLDKTNKNNQEAKNQVEVLQGQIKAQAKTQASLKEEMLSKISAQAETVKVSSEKLEKIMKHLNIQTSQQEEEKEEEQ